MDPVVEIKTEATPIVPAQPAVDIEKIRAEAAQSENKRIREITLLGKKFKQEKLADSFCTEGGTIEKFREEVLEKMANPEPLDQLQPLTQLDLSKKEVKQYSLVKAIYARASRNWDLAPYEHELSIEVGKKLKRESEGFYVPMDIQNESLMRHMTRAGRERMIRDLTVSPDTAGGHTVSTDLLADRFIDILRNAMRVEAAGATMLTGLVGNVAIPRHTTASTAAFVAEGVAVAEQNQAFDQVTMSPKTLGAFTDISRKLLLQSSIDIESFVRRDLAVGIALAIDNAALNGDGTGANPTGIANTAGIGAVDVGANGGPVTWEHIVFLEREVDQDNALDGSLSYMTNAKLKAKLKTTEKASSTAQFIFDVRDSAQPVNGYQLWNSNQVLSNISKGSGTNLSQIFFGNWADLLIGMWGVLDILVDPFTASTTGTVRVVTMQDIDIAIRHAESFSLLDDADTT